MACRADRRPGPPPARPARPTPTSRPPRPASGAGTPGIDRRTPGPDDTARRPRPARPPRLGAAPARTAAAARRPRPPRRHPRTSNAGPDDRARRRPGAELDRWIRVRDRHCVAPWCRRPAHKADLDHTLAHARGGPTSSWNLGAWCTHDHRAKHHAGWTVRQPRPGRFVIRTRAGITYTSHPKRITEPLPAPKPGRPPAAPARRRLGRRPHRHPRRHRPRLVPEAHQEDPSHGDHPDPELLRRRATVLRVRPRLGHEETRRATTPTADRDRGGRRSGAGTQARDIGTPIPGSTRAGPFFPGLTSKSKIPVGM